MLAAAQLGGLAAVFVLLLPMALAGFHVSRNKVLFFGGALFISLAIVAHLAPHVPSFLVVTNRPARSSRHLPSCLLYLHRLTWSHSDDSSPSYSWSSVPSRCRVFRRLTWSEASVLLNGSWVIVAGDSQARLFVLALLRFLLDPAEAAAIEPDLFRRHSDYSRSFPDIGLTVDFIWAPFESNLTHLAGELQHSHRLPDILILGSGLWHMLHVGSPENYGNSLAALKRAAEKLHDSVLHMFWIGLPELITPMLNTAEKQARMTSTTSRAYAQEVVLQGITKQQGGPLFLLDVGTITGGCGARCTEDGMHYNAVVYDAALHVMLNALLIESQQRV